MAKTIKSTVSLLKIAPKLRMIANGDSFVNTIRAERSPCVAVRSGAALKAVQQMRASDDQPEAFNSRTMKRGHLRQVAEDVLVSVFVTMRGPVGLEEIPGQTARRGNLIAATLRLDQVSAVATRPNVMTVEPGEKLVPPRPLTNATAPSRPSPSHRRIEGPVAHRGGRGVLIGIIDVQGFDFAHEDFRHGNNKTRFVRIWDQGGNARPSPGGRFNYGAELKEEHLNAAIAGAQPVAVAPQDLEPQSQMVDGSHGTHVASIAAGNLGLCNEAKIAAVLVSLPPEDYDPRKAFYDSTRLAHAVDYLLELADEMNMPVSINISLGTNGHAHDGSSPISRWIDSALVTPGRSVCVAAGNAGQEAPQSRDDIGYIMGRIHTSGTIPAAGLDRDIEWIVVGNGIADLSENEMEVWYSAQDRFSISIRPPNMGWIGPVRPGQFIENRRLNGGTLLSVYNEVYHPTTGCNYTGVYLSPFFSPNAVAGVAAGTWLVRLHGDDVRDGTYHAWIERDDPRPLDPIGGLQGWAFPSFLSQSSNVDSSSVSSLACGHSIVSVANLDAPRDKVNITSSQGPTRDGRAKPEIAAPGTDIVAARGFSAPSTPWISMTGTSMASPYVTGVVGLMLAVNPRLTAAQIGGILQRTARPLPGHDFAWRDDAGYGVIDPEACLEQARTVDDRQDMT